MTIENHLSYKRVAQSLRGSGTLGVWIQDVQTGNSVFPKETKTAIARLVEVKDVEEILSIAGFIESEIKSVLRSMFSVRCGQRTDLSMYAHAIKRKIRHKQVKEITNLDWWVHLG